MKSKIIDFVMIMVGISILLLFFVRGNKNLMSQNKTDSYSSTQLMGPFESSGSSSRFVLTQAIVDNHKFILSPVQAKLASPDVAGSNGRYYTIFTPGVSFLGIPFYYIGDLFGHSQLATYFLTTLLASLNFYLIYQLANKLGASRYLSLLSAFVFTFTTNALAYSNSFTQHHLSTVLILLAFFNATKVRSMKNDFIFGILYSAGLLADIPNGIMMLPLLVYILARHFKNKIGAEGLKIRLSLNFIYLVLGMLPLLLVFGFYNKNTTGSYFRLAQFSGRSKDFAQEQQEVPLPVTESSKSIISVPYDTRLQLNGLYILLTSDERGIFYYSPILLFGLAGLIILYKKKEKRYMAILLFGVALMDIMSYSMFGDPWGGWAFGPRYLIPAEAILSAGIGVCIEKIKSNKYLVIAAVIISLYSLFVSIIGAATSTQIPPKVEAVNLVDKIPYTYRYNIQLLDKNESGSLVFNTLLKGSVTVWSYVYTLFIIFGLADIYMFIKSRQMEI